MATQEQMIGMAGADSRESAVNHALTRSYTLNWEVIAWALILALALITRLVDLGVRVMSHDESLHTYYSWRLFEYGEFSHTPLMHGPLLFHMTALSYYLFGDTDFTARLYPVVLGIGIVMFPLLFRRWLGRVGAICAAVLLLISPQMLYYTRYIRHDIPTIFFALLILYAIVQYIDGERPRRSVWLGVLGGALLGMLASKEVSFIYIAIFGSFLTLFWLMRVLQDISFARRTASGATAHALRGRQVLGHVLLAGIVALAALPYSALIRQILAPTLWIPSSVWIMVPLFLVIWVPLALAGRIRRGRGAALALVDALDNGRSALYVIVGGLVLGAIVALLVVGVIDIIKPGDVWPARTVRSAEDLTYGANLSKEYATATGFDGAMAVRQLTWIGLPTLALLFVVFVTAVLRVPGDLPVPWRAILLLLLITLIVAGLLVMAERRSFVSETSEQPFAVDPTAAHLQDGANYKSLPIVVAWIVGVVLTAAIVLTRLYTDWWSFLNRQPIFDVLIVIGTLILPWLAGFPLYWAGYNLEEYNINIAEGRDTVEASLFTVIPFIMVSVSVGLAWNWRRWWMPAAIFIGLFAFFFTTVFSNQNGIVTGMIGSLGYWLEQQGVRRGSQPQYYYLLTQVPVYEFLPALASLGAGLLGLVHLWDWRARRMRAAQAERAAGDAQGAGEVDAAASGEVAPESGTITRVASAYRTQPMAIAQTASSLPGARFRPFDIQEESARRIADPEWIGAFPFLLLVGWWSVMMLFGLSMAGEKMPWLTTHITTPLTLAGGWFLGRVITGLHRKSLQGGGWLLLLVLMPVGFVALTHVWTGLWGAQPPFGGRDVRALTATSNWIGALLVALGVVYAVGRYGRRLGWGQLGRLAVASAALVLAIVTVRTAYLAAYIDYDYATEFLVYAHSGPAVKTVLNEVDRIAELTNEGTGMRIVFDDESSWPLTWYFRHYTNYAFMRGEAGSVDPASLEGARVIVVGNKKVGDVRRIVGDRYYEFSYFRLWWPMQEYFNLTYARIARMFSTDPDNIAAPYYRQGIWDIWFDRDYSTYAQAMCIDTRQFRCEEEAARGQTADEQDQFRAACERALVLECAGDDRFSVSKWPVSDRMYFFVDKQIAAQVWDAGIGSSTVNIREPQYAEDKVYLDIEAERTLGEGAGMLNPRGVALDDQGLIYVTDTDRNRIVVFDADGLLVRTIGDAATAPPGEGLRQPWGLDIGPDGLLYVADTWNNRVAVFTREGVFLRAWGHEGVPASDPSPEAMWGPRELEIGPDGLVYLADTGGKRIRVYQSDGTWVRDIGTGGANPGQLDEPVGLAFNPINQELYVAEAWNKRISVFALDGQFLRAFNVNMWFRNRQSFNRPYLATSPDGTLIFATDMDERRRIVAYNLSGVPVFSFDQPDNLEAGVLGLRSPAGMAFDSSGRLIVVDAELARLFVFPPSEAQGAVNPSGAGVPGAGEVDAAAAGEVAPEAGPVGAIPPLDAPLLTAGSPNAQWSPVARTINGVKMVYTPGGCFRANTPGAEFKTFCVSPFWMSQTEITNAQYAACVDEGACTPLENPVYLNDPAYAQAPVVYLSWQQAVDVAQWIGGRLPTELEWEYAARGPEGWLYPWGDRVPTCALANTDGCGGLLPVGGTERLAGRSWAGALDLGGSVAEWTMTWFTAEYYPFAAAQALDPSEPETGTARAVRGGSWSDGPEKVLSTYRGGRNPALSYPTVGVRVVIPAGAVNPDLLLE